MELIFYNLHGAYILKRQLHNTGMIKNSLHSSSTLTTSTIGSQRNKKARISIVREAERDYHHLKRDGFKKEAEVIKVFILEEFADLNGYALDTAHKVFEEKQIEKKKNNAYSKQYRRDFNRSLGHVVKQ